MQSDDERLNPESGKKLKTAEWVKAFVDILRTDGGLSLGTVLKAVLATQTKILGKATVKEAEDSIASEFHALMSDNEHHDGNK